jgi:hypothetical protein
MRRACVPSRRWRAGAGCGTAVGRLPARSASSSARDPRTVAAWPRSRAVSGRQSSPGPGVRQGAAGRLRGALRSSARWSCSREPGPRRAPARAFRRVGTDPATLLGRLRTRRAWMRGVMAEGNGPVNRIHHGFRPECGFLERTRDGEPDGRVTKVARMRCCRVRSRMRSPERRSQAPDRGGSDPRRCGKPRPGRSRFGAHRVSVPLTTTSPPATTPRAGAPVAARLIPSRW